MPTTITIDYVSDFGQAETATSQGKAWLEWSMINGDTYYEATPGTLTVQSATQFTLTLARSGVDPTGVGDYMIGIKVKLWYNNGGQEFQMDEVDYTFIVNIAGAPGSTLVHTTTGATTSGSFSVPTVEETDVGIGEITSPTPTITLAQTGSNVAFGTDIVLEATTGSSSHTLWVDPTENIIASANLNFADELDYEWPNTAVTSSVSADSSPTTTTTVTVNLKSIPVAIFELGTIYVQLTVHFRDNSNDARRTRRFLRGLEDGSIFRDVGTRTGDDSTGSQETTGNEMEDGSARFVAKVTFATDDSGSTIVSSFMVVSATTALAAGAALLI